MTPKSLLRSAQVASPLETLIDGRFAEILDDPAPPEKPERLVFCSGKIYWELVEERERTGSPAALVRVEQFYPFPDAAFAEVADRYHGVQNVVWAQEEPRNRGGWTFMVPHLSEIFPNHEIQFAGRPPSASPATGSLRVHREQQEAVIRAALGAV